MTDTTTAVDERIICQIDGAKVHSIQIHLRDNHPDWTVERYQAEYPDAPLLSGKAKAKLEEVARRKAAAGEATAMPAANANGVAHLHEVFGFGNAPAARSKSGSPIEITIVKDRSEEALPYVADIDQRYVFDIGLVKKVIVGLEINKPTYLWGYHGTGKTTVFEQVAARTGRPFVRVQHTSNTEESHILGQFLFRDGETKFNLGPLPTAMLFGFVYCADEYDVAMPGVVALYQPVLEGKPLVIKEAPPELRVIKPHSNFRFCATGNTPGIGDETGLYQGTVIQNAANYSRFGITEEVTYMKPEVEESVLVSQARLSKPIAAKIVKFANEVREQFMQGKISMTVSPRELINAATLGIAFGGDWMEGLRLAFINRMSREDRQLCGQWGQRIFGE